MLSRGYPRAESTGRMANAVTVVKSARRRKAECRPSSPQLGRLLASGPCATVVTPWSSTASLGERIVGLIVDVQGAGSGASQTEWSLSALGVQLAGE